MLKSLLSQFADTADNAILIADDSDRIVYCNNAAQKLTRVEDREELLGDSLVSWLPALHISAPVAANSLAKEFVLVLNIRSGQSIPVHITKSVKTLRNGTHTMVVIRDQSELNELRRRTMLQSALMQLTASPCLIQSKTGEIETVNPAFEHLFGYEAQEVIGRAPRDFLYGPQTNLAEVQAGGEAVHHGGRVARDEALYRKDGTVIWIAYEQSAVCNDLGEVSHIVTSGTDITERRKAEQMKTDFVAMVGHELRTPLTVIAGTLDALADKRFFDLPAAARELLTMSQDNCRVLNMLIGDLLDINKIEAGLVAMSLQSVSVSECVNAAIGDISAKATADKVIIHPPTGSDVVQVVADPTRLKQVIVNLVSNAVKFSGPQGEVWLSWHASGDEVLILVKDNGPGIRDEFRPDLFERFTRDPSASAAGIEGFGLGLSICHGLVTQMKGRIDVFSEMGNGTEISVRLPLADETVMSITASADQETLSRHALVAS